MADLSIDAVIIGGCGKGKTYIPPPASEVVNISGGLFVLNSKAFSPFMLNMPIEPPPLLSEEERSFRIRAIADYGPVLMSPSRFMLMSSFADCGPTITTKRGKFVNGKRPRVHCISLRRRYRNR